MAPDDVVPLADWGDAGDVKEKLEEVARAATGVLLVYYAGHGLVDADGKLHLALRRTNPGQLENTAVAFDSVFRRLAYSPAREIIVILDCCFAGSALTPDGILNRGYTVPRGIDGGYILTSVARDERAMAPPGERYTAFSGELLAYLRDGDPDGGENLTMGAAARYLKDKLQARGLPQPEPGSSGDGDQIALAGNPAYQPGPALPSTATMTASRPAPARAPTPPPGPRPKTPGPDPAPDPDASQSTMTFNRMGPPSPVPSVPFRPPTRPIAPPAPSSVPPAPDPAPDPNPAPDPGSAKPGDPGDPGGPGGPGGPGRPGGLRGLERRRGCAIGGVISVFVIVGLILAFTLPGTSKHTPPAGPTRSPTAASSPTTVVCPTGTPAGTPTLTLVGSTAFAPVAQTVAGEYMKQCPGAVIKFDAKDSASGFSALILDEQSDPAAANSMIAMFDGTDTISPGSVTGYPTGATVFAVVANSKGFHQPAVSIQQLKQIFVAGEPGVVAVGRLRGSGSREALLRGALGLPNWQSIPVTAPACPPKSRMFCTEDYTSQVLDTVNANPNEVGYAGYQEFIDKSAQYQNLDVLRINDVAPSAQSVEDRQYNFWAIEHVYTSKHPTALAGDFLAYLRQHLRSSQQDGFVGCEYVPAGPDNDCQS
jgi:ABC-type phosphate transport system substrate-binding protein